MPRQPRLAQLYAGDTLVATIETVGTTTTPYYPHTDHLGSTNAVTNSAGATVELLDYYPYGAQRLSSGTHTEQRQYIGQVYDGDTGLAYLNARYYAPNTGKFVSEDPMFWEVGETREGKQVLLNPQLQNSYSYAGDNPIVSKDPSGRSLKTFTEGVVSPFVYAYNHPVQTAVVVAATTAAVIVAPVAVTVASVAVGSYAVGTAGYNAYTASNSDTRDYYLGQGVMAGALTVAGFKSGISTRNASWEYGSFKTQTKWNSQFQLRGWTSDLVTDAIRKGKSYKADNKINPGNGATRYVSPANGQSVVIDNKTRELLHVGGKGFNY